MNGNLKRGICGIGILFLIFCLAMIINNFLDRSGNDNIIISQESQTEQTTIIETELTSETVSSTNETEKNEKSDFNGYLKYTEKNGDIYDGEWSNGKYNGTGKLTRKTSEIYDGKWIDGAFASGDITYKINNFGGTKTSNVNYDENWNGTGKCAMIIESGAIYDGQWYDGKRNGNGSLYTRGKHEVPTKFQTGLWEDDILVDGTETTLYTDNKQTYVVEIKNGFRNGKGSLYDENGNIIQEENWLDDQIIE